MVVSGPHIGPIFKDQSSEDGTDRLSRNLDTYKSTSRNVPEEPRYHLRGSGSLKSRRKQRITQARGPASLFHKKLSLTRVSLHNRWSAPASTGILTMSTVRARVRVESHVKLCCNYDVRLWRILPTTRPKPSLFLTQNVVSEYTVDITYIILDNSYMI
jgi:hypothetical protein